MAMAASRIKKQPSSSCASLHSDNLRPSVLLVLLFFFCFVAVSFPTSAASADQGTEEGDATTTTSDGGLHHHQSSFRTKLFHKTQNEEGKAGDDWLNAGGDMTVSGGLLDSLFTSFSMILVTEIGDETFIIAALLAMRHPRAIVLSGALSALIIMTVLSTGLGRIVPNLISKKHTNTAATVLYAFFGIRLLYIAWRSSSAVSQQKEFEEVEEKLEGAPQGKTAWRKVLSRFCTPIFLEAFILTFLAEWGDRSQIATIALATHKNAVGVTIGATVGHTICTTLAVIGGRLLALKISQKTVATVGGLLFLGFSLSSYFYPPL